MKTAMKVAVVGATGRVGRHVVELLKLAGYDAVALSRSSGANVITTAGLADALSGVVCIIDTATTASADQMEATAFFTTSARNLHEFGARAGVNRIVAVSIVGCDRYTAGYGAAKRAHELVLLSGSIPVRILRATQFHEFVPQVMEWDRRDGVCCVPEMRTQLVSARTVARRLVDLATGLESTPEASEVAITEMGGPREENLVAMARLFAARHGDQVRIEGVIDASDPDRALNLDGGLLPGSNALLAGPTFEAWLSALAL